MIDVLDSLEGLEMWLFCGLALQKGRCGFGEEEDDRKIGLDTEGVEDVGDFYCRYGT